MKNANNHTLLVFLLAALTSVTPLAVDTYLPAMPEIATYLGVGIEKIELTISIFLIFFALGQLLGGTLSDRVGRKKTALFGLFLFAISNFALFMATTLEELYVFRAFQAFFGGMAIVNSSAMVRDLFSGKEAAKVFSTIASITMIAPMIAPAIGAVIISYFNWRYVFLFLFIYSLIVSLTLLLKLKETGVKTKSKVFVAFKKVLTHKIALSYILAQSFAFSGMFIFIGKSSFIYMEYFHTSTKLFPFLFGANVLMMIIFTRINIKIVQKYEPKNIMKMGIIFQVIAGLGLLSISFNPNIYLVFIGLVIFIGTLGFIFGNGIASALEYFQKDSGIANSVIGVTGFAIAGIIGFISSMIHTGELIPVFAMMSITSILSFLSLKLKDL